MNPIISFRLDKPEPRLSLSKLAWRLFVGGLALYGAIGLAPGVWRMIVKRVGG